MATAEGLTIAVTGASGFIATELIHRLSADDRIGRILGFDVRPSSLSADKYVFDQLDVRNPKLEGRLGGADALVHLAFVMDPIKDESLMHDVNVAGSNNAFACAAAAGVPRVVYTSSATVYGAHPDNDVPLTEDSPLRANLDFNYPAHKLEVEYLIREFRAEHPDIVFTNYRPAIVQGPHVDNAWSHFVEYPVLFGVKGYDPLFQFVHESDVARALVFALFNDLDGDYNVAPRGWLETDETLAIIGRTRTLLGEPAAFALMERLWSIGLAEAPAGILHYVMHPWVVSPARLEEAGVECAKSNSDTLTEAVEHMEGYVRLGRSRIRRKSLARGAVAGSALAVALALYGATRRLPA
jgi:nucleoside-diphosphate-sugar epimerase